MDMGVGKIFSRKAAQGDFSKIFLAEAKSGKICFFPLETKKKTFLLKFSKSNGVQALPCPPSDAHVRRRNMVNIHNPLTALLGWDKLSSDC